LAHGGDSYCLSNGTHSFCAFGNSYPTYLSGDLQSFGGTPYGSGIKCVPGVASAFSPLLNYTCNSSTGLYECGNAVCPYGLICNDNQTCVTDTTS
jgi:hypothetical protein